MQMPAAIGNAGLKTISESGTEVAHSMLQVQTTLRALSEAVVF